MKTFERQHATLAEVASAAGVSLTTASRSLRNSPAVREETKRRVLAAARDLNYEANHLARSLRLQRTGLVGVVVPDIATGFYGRAVKGALRVLHRSGYTAMVMNTEREAAQEAAVLRTLLAHRVEGMLVATSGGFEPPVRAPVVFFDNLVPGYGAGHVARNNVEGMRTLVTHLAEHGHKRIAYIGGPSNSTSGQERLEGFYRAMTGLGLNVDPSYLAFGDLIWSGESGRAAIRSLLALPEPPTAVAVASEDLALGALQGARQAGARVPADLALISFDDPYFGDLFDPAITALAHNEEQVGELAATLLVHALDHPITDQPAEVRLPLRLIARRSCGCEYGTVT